MTSPIPVLVTGHILHCDVIINQIESIQVVTTVRQLFTDDPPLQLSVRAFDSEGTVISLLKFLWDAVCLFC